MARTPPGLYFRIRDGGALVFRLGEVARQGRMDMEPVASVHMRADEIRPQRGRDLTQEERGAIRAWMTRRRAVLARREAQEADLVLEALGNAAQWAQNRATPETLDAATDDLLLALHDLRSVLLRKRSAPPKN